MRPRVLTRQLTHRVTIERPIADNSLDGAGSGAWEPLGAVWADVQDKLPSRAEVQSGGITTMFRPARIRMRFRTDITPDMRFVMGARTMYITSGPAEIGFREGLELMVAEYIPQGNPA